jgi:hypothetical protein
LDCLLEADPALSLSFSQVPSGDPAGPKLSDRASRAELVPAIVGVGVGLAGIGGGNPYQSALTWERSAGTRLVSVDLVQKQAGWTDEDGTTDEAVDIV